MSREGFLQAIREEPEDDTHRLVFADWLEEFGDASDRAYAEFIRLQLELEPVRFEIDRPRVRELLEREKALLFDHADAWLGPVAREFTSTLDFSDPGPYFRRGVPELLALSLDDLLAHGAELLAAYPTIQELTVFDVQGQGRELAACPLLEQISTLEVADWLGASDAAALLASSLFRTRPTLRVWDDLTPEENLLWGLNASAWPAGPRIEVLELAGASFGEPGHIPPRLDDLARSFAVTGPTVVPVRPYLNRFPLLPDQGQNLHPGVFGDGRRVLFAHNRDATEPVVFAFFDADGNLLDAHEAPDPGCCTYYEDYATWLTREFGYVPGLLWMREFETHRGLGVHLLVHEPGPTDPWDLWDWLYRGKYAIAWCNLPWASRRSGEITDT
jgi:uncharacterized protein (TIGR02996 family)